MPTRHADCCTTCSITRAVSVRASGVGARLQINMLGVVGGFNVCLAVTTASVDAAVIHGDWCARVCNVVFVRTRTYRCVVPLSHTNGNRDAPGARHHCLGYDAPPCRITPLHCFTIGTSMITPHSRCSCRRWWSASRRDRRTTMTVAKLF